MEKIAVVFKREDFTSNEAWDKFHKIFENEIEDNNADWDQVTVYILVHQKEDHDNT